MNTFKRNKGGWSYSNEKGMMIINAEKADREEEDDWWLYDENEELLGKYKTLYDAEIAGLLYQQYTNKETNTMLLEKHEVFTDNAEIIDIFGQGCHYPTTKGVAGFQVEFDVELYNCESGSKRFHIVFQSDERVCNIRAYSGYEMSAAKRFGCDADESNEALEFMGWDYDWLDELQKTAEEECKKWLEGKA